MVALMLTSGCSALRPNTLGSLDSLTAGPLPANLQGRLIADIQLLRELDAQLADLQTDRDRLAAELCSRAGDSDHRLYTPDEEEAILDQFHRSLLIRRRLLDLAGTYARYDTAPAGGPATQAFLIYASAAVLVQELDLRTIGYACLPQPHGTLLRRKLNEPHQDRGIPPGAFDMICRSVATGRGRELCRSLLERLRHQQQQAPAGDLQDDQKWLAQTIERAGGSIDARRGDAQKAWDLALMDSGVETIYLPFYQLQKGFCQAISNVHTPRACCISPGQIDELSQRLRPGDIVLIRRYGHLTNAFLPGFWTHAVIYLGQPEDIRRLGLDEKAIGGAAGLPPAPFVIETRSKGVYLESLQVAADADCVLALRPHLAPEEIDKALKRALSYLGTAYDFDFDFFTADRVTCTEMVYRAYGETLGLRPKLKYQRYVMSAQDIADSLAPPASQASQASQATGRLEFVSMLIGDEKSGAARLATQDQLPRP